MREVVIRDRDNMSLLGLMLKTILDQNLARPWRYERIRPLDRAIGLGAGGMKVTIAPMASGPSPECAVPRTRRPPGHLVALG